MQIRLGGTLPLAALLLLSTAVSAGESGLAVGAFAPPLNGKVWTTDDGKQPDMKEKVLLVEFWFAG
jgi:hypothetical protein